MTTTTHSDVTVVDDGNESTLRDLPKPEFTDAEAGAREFPDSTARRYNYYTPQKRKQSHYEDVTVEVQPDPRHYLSQGWLYGFSDGRGGYPLDWTALKAWGSDRPEPERFPGSGGRGYDWPATGWHEFRDPNEEWELTLYRYNANVVRQINANIDTARETKAFEQWNPNWVQFVERNIGAWMHVEHGLGLYLFANANRRAPTNMHNNAISVNSMHRIRFAQDLALYNLTLSEEIDGFDGVRAHRDVEQRPGLAGRPQDRRAAHRDRRLVRGDLRRERGLRAARRRAVPQPARAAGLTQERRLRHADGRRCRRARLRRPGPALHHGDVRAADQRPEFADHNKAHHGRVALGLGASRHLRRPHAPAAVVPAGREATALRGRPRPRKEPLQRHPVRHSACRNRRS